MNIYKVKSQSLNLRTTPEITARNIIAVLPEGHLIIKSGEIYANPWWKINTILQGVAVDGFLNSSYVAKVKPVADNEYLAPVITTIPAAHLLTKEVVARKSKFRRAYALNEQKQPYRTAATIPEKLQQIGAVINWLNVEVNVRYLPDSGSTFCNIYACDYCFLNKCYLPRVWWTRNAMAALNLGQLVRPLYGATVTELNANSLANWLEEFGPDFGWRRALSPDELQAAANKGQVSLIAAQRKDLNRPGHICAVVPEIGTHQAKRDKAGKVLIPLQSQAGSHNFNYGGRLWWTGKQFQKYSFWIHA